MKDQELENIMRQIASDAALDDATANEVADSPALWWSVQRELRAAMPAEAGWPPNLLRRLLMIIVPVTAALLVGLGLYINNVKRSSSPDTALVSAPPSQQTPSTEAPLPVVVSGSAPAAIAANRNTRFAAVAAKAVVKVHSAKLARALTARNSDRSDAVIKSDFIALAYARSPESGQLVRVKVPSSMMVQLGVVPTVNDPSKLIDAEVLVGDDGLTHAIRFIRQ